MIQKKKTKRAFNGLAGSPFVKRPRKVKPKPAEQEPVEVIDGRTGMVIPVPASDAAAPKKRGRPRIHADNKAKQKHHRKMQKINAPKPESPDDALSHASSGGRTTIADGALDIIDAHSQAKEGDPEAGYVSKSRYTNYEGEVVSADQVPGDYKEQDGTFVDKHLTDQVLEAFIKQRGGPLDKNEAERIVKDLANFVFASDNRCNQCDKIILSGQIMHLWTDHVAVIHKVLKETAGSRGCPKAFHQLLFEYPKEVLTVKCPICGKKMTQPGILHPESINRPKEPKDPKPELYNRVLQFMQQGRKDDKKSTRRKVLELFQDVPKSA